MNTNWFCLYSRFGKDRISFIANVYTLYGIFISMTMDIGRLLFGRCMNIQSAVFVSIVFVITSLMLSRGIQDHYECNDYECGNKDKTK